MKNYCDLHVHSTKSDGTLSPSEIVKKAKELGLGAVAITDHNSVSGVEEFMNSGAELGVKTVAGVEVSCDYNDTELHILALFIPSKNLDRVTEFFKKARALKEESNRTTVAKMQADGYDVDYDQMVAENPGTYLNRVHLAKILIKKGYVKTVDEAFDTILSKEGKYYVQPKRPQAFDVIDFIRSVGAVSVLAHPFLNLTESQLIDFLTIAVARGLDAMETDYSEFDAEQTNMAKNIAVRFGIKNSGGSDFHGANKPHIRLGKAYQNERIPLSYCDELEKIAIARQS